MKIAGEQGEQMDASSGIICRSLKYGLADTYLSCEHAFRLLKLTILAAMYDPAF